MSIPEQATRAAAKEIWNVYVGRDLSWYKKFSSAYDRNRAEETARAALEAALPHIRDLLIKEIRADSVAMQEAADSFGLGSYSGRVSSKAEGMSRAVEIIKEILE